MLRVGSGQHFELFGETLETSNLMEKYGAPSRIHGEGCRTSPYVTTPRALRLFHALFGETLETSNLMEKYGAPSRIHGENCRASPPRALRIFLAPATGK